MSSLRAHGAKVQCRRRRAPCGGVSCAADHAERNMNRSIQHLIVFLVLVVGGGWIIGATNLPGSWYAGLHKPSFTPPNLLFPVAWTVLYVLIAIAGWRT